MVLVGTDAENGIWLASSSQTSRNVEEKVSTERDVRKMQMRSVLVQTIELPTPIPSS